MVKRQECIKLNCFFLLFVFFAVERSFGQNQPAAPQESPKAEVSLRPKVEYTAESTRNPFTIM